MGFVLAVGHSLARETRTSDNSTFSSSPVPWEEVAAGLPATPALARDRFTGERAPGCPDGQLLVLQTNAGAGTGCSKARGLQFSIFPADNVYPGYLVGLL